jgi:hypothetical protein
MRRRSRLTGAGMTSQPTKSAAMSRAHHGRSSPQEWQKHLLAAEPTRHHREGEVHSHRLGDAARAIAEGHRPGKTRLSTHTEAKVQLGQLLAADLSRAQRRQLHDALLTTAAPALKGADQRANPSPQPLEAFPEAEDVGLRQADHQADPPATPLDACPGVEAVHPAKVDVETARQRHRQATTTRHFGTRSHMLIARRRTQRSA